MQRRTPGGQRPARPGQSGRPGGSRAARTPAREGGVRAEQRATSGRAPGTTRATEGVRATNRPAAARRTASGGTVRRLSAPHPRGFTGRATVLFAVLIALALGYTYPVRVYLDQQADIERMEAAQAAQRRAIDELAVEAAKWQDERYIAIKARERFQMGRPGETLLVVLSAPEDAAGDAGRPAGAGQPTAPAAWYDTLWSSVQGANVAQPDQ
ncbi:FtsB family cell division protein [Micromonospora endolithica]|uniref:Septum formation initiator family protein n=1 Tax=Micromonospora endolithica TaxID=230091 RepID=A0A3A9Z8K6_9ACTN|nr:septum formation initiator family protein [Micromonospora endolithica]RKN43596.1 septum formation initiator family protein [Micromonospora endolithica]TWJ23976.1 cell division protein FtsB [Micromonospora endolithica]